MRKYIKRGKGDQINVESVGQYIAAPSTPRDSVMAQLLGVVQQEVKERLAQSLHRAVDSTLLNLGKALEPQQVRSRWAMEVSVQEHPPQLLPPETTIAQVFELPEIEQKLLILGEPGSGKTTTLVELAQTLVEKALNEAEAPIPVLVNLSSWKDPQQSIFDWLVGELASKYVIRQALVRRFLAQKCLLPFLDGLDEIATDRQTDCALGLNAWLVGDIEQQPVGIVVCCRHEEYETIVRKRLFLPNSVALQPLSDEQIEAYLTQFKLDTVCESVQASPQLQNLLRKPLFLAVFGIGAKQFEFSEWQQRSTDEARIEYLFDRYWDATINRALVDAQSQEKGILSKTYGKKEPPDSKMVRRALVFAAKAMEQEPVTDELLIERMQPTWLRNTRQKFLYRFIVGLIVGLILELIGGLTAGIIAVPSFGLLGGLIGWLIAGINIDPVEAVKISMSYEVRRKIFRSLREQLIFGLIGGLLGGLIAAPIFGFIGGLTVGLITGFIGGLTVGLITGFIKALKADIESQITPNQGIKNSWKNMLIMIGAAILTMLPFKLLLEKLLASSLDTHQTSTIIAITSVDFFCFSLYAAGGLALLQHITLRIILAWNGYAPYRYDKLLDYCTERLLLQRIGGRYRFMHKLLQEHFAKMPLD
jgi:DNA polymerase III delta prime subunit